MPTFVHGKDTAFKLDNAAGSLTDLSAYSPKVGISRPQEVHDVTTFGATARAFALGLKDGDDIVVEFIYDNALEVILNAINALTTGASQTFEYHPEGTASGKPKYSGECFLKNYSVASDVGDMLKITATLQKTGAVTHATN